ncbi:hypothetical protein GCM10007036_31860 [Alsobacter metallidurans]|uniref:Uncharacterized protein n=1 Tax=Alsobacter metallidurans TaxID=340221 RepID=A0A917MIQ7_9HYPH|nr:hypothetical protein [Alsobacter metallidurans]GGH25029.1 hypothetical protein GCM10007036_31860 [Alsobacter metallidurans]
MASWFEKRRQRKRRRERMEELLAWIVVPALAFGVYWGWLQVRDQIKNTPLMAIISGKDKGAPQ